MLAVTAASELASLAEVTGVAAAALAMVNEQQQRHLLGARCTSDKALIGVGYCTAPACSPVVLKAVVDQH